MGTIYKCDGAFKYVDGYEEDEEEYEYEEDEQDEYEDEDYY